ncbi:MAG: transporter substrate-binding domain-containing protein [Chitinispirillales bacterium]|jgi:polar amino acid transport system substrate-binding protein|nr:transporter substrate-binding domain-containing protein [Chitinispirillales bacterium]
MKVKAVSSTKAIFAIAALSVSVAFAAFGCGGKGDAQQGDRSAKADEAAVVGVGSNMAKGVFAKEEFAGKTLAILNGSSFDAVARERVGAKLHKFFDSPAKGVEAVLAGEADATVAEEPVARKFASQNPDKLVVLYPPIDIENYAPIFPKKDGGKLVGEFNAFLTAARGDGTTDDMIKRWIDTPDSPPMPVIELKNPKKKVLKFATSDCDPPFSMKDGDGKLVGFDVEMAMRFAQTLGCGLEVKVMDFADIIPAVAAGTVDFAANVITITEERKTLVDFSEPVYFGGTVVLARK